LDQSIGCVRSIEKTDGGKSGTDPRLWDVGPAIPQKDTGPEHLEVGTDKEMSKVVKTDIKADNGVIHVIHVIDAVILP
jgi:hypothetical protein